MRTLAILAIFAPIRLCSFNNGPDIWWETARWDTGGWDFDAELISPRDGEIWRDGQSIVMEAQVFSGGDLTRFSGVFMLDGDVLCEVRHDWDGVATCQLDLPSPIPEERLGVSEVTYLMWTPTGRELFFSARVELASATDPDTDVDSEPDTDVDTDPVVTGAFAVTSPAPSSQWAAATPIPFVVQTDTSVIPADSRVVWEIDGVQVPALTVRTNAQGIGVGATTFPAGPHEAAAIVVVDTVQYRASTRFIVEEDADPDTDTEADTEADTGTVPPAR